MKKTKEIFIISLFLLLSGCDCEKTFIGIECPQILDSYLNQERYKQIEENYEIIKNLDRKETVIEIMGKPDFIEKNDHIIPIDTLRLVWKTNEYEYSIIFINEIVVSKTKKTKNSDN